MARPSMRWMAFWCALFATIVPGLDGRAEQTPAAPQPQGVTSRADLYPQLDDAFLRWPLPAGAERYATIDGKRMHRDVVEQALISRRYRDKVHPKFWGRITGTSSDQESAEWLAAKFKTAGLSDIKIQPLDLEPQWMPQTWSATISGAGKTVKTRERAAVLRRQRVACRWCGCGSGLCRTWERS